MKLEGVEPVMEFSSMIFVCFFLLLSLIPQVVAKTQKGRNVGLLVASLVFYGWNGPGYLLLLVVLTGICYLFGLLIQVAGEIPQRRKRLTLALVLVLLAVAFFQYRGFLCTVTHGIFGVPQTVPTVVLPFGLGYYSLRLISYLLEVYRGHVRAEKKLWMMLLYVCLFPLAMGPVGDYGALVAPLNKRKTSNRSLGQGISRFSIGLAKVAILANTLSDLGETLLVATQPALGLWLGLLTSGLGLYFLLSGVADMGIGIGRMLGFSFPEHFDHPFTAYTISDFWSRWQITLVGFFQKYLSNPLGDTQKTGWKEILKMLGVWLLLGLWQGPSWSYVLWGLYFWALLVLEEFALWPFLEKAPWALRRILTQILVFLSFALLFCGELENLPALLLGLVGRHGLVSKAFFTTLICQAPILILGIVAATNLGKRLRKKLSLMAKQGGPALVVDSLWEAIHPVALLLLSAMALAGVTSNPFLMIQL